jgi:ATP-dependent Clp protease ATP-binding subunit ClpA
VPFTEAAKGALEHSLRESLGLRHSYIGTEHILLGLLHEQKAARMLADLGADAQRVREQVLGLLG